MARADFPGLNTSPDLFRDVASRDRNPFAVLALDGGDIVGVLSGIIEGGEVVCGQRWCPQVAMLRGGDRGRIGDTLLDGLRKVPGTARALLVIYSFSELDAMERGGFRKRVSAGEDHGIVMLDLAPGKDKLLAGMSESRRNKVRRAIRNGVEVSRFDLARDFDDFFAIYKDWADFKDLPSSDATEMRETFGQTDHRLVLAARHKGQLVGVSSWRMTRGGMMEYAANWSRREETKARPNDLLMWRALEWGVDNGVTTFSMCGSHFFLRGFGGEIVPVYRYSRDQTVLHHHHARESAIEMARHLYRMAPEPIRRMVKR